MCVCVLVHGCRWEFWDKGVSKVHRNRWNNIGMKRHQAAHDFFDGRSHLSISGLGTCTNN